jgi:Lon protease-like protein
MATRDPDLPDDLAIFPLATVLFPGAILPLHIFEERYKLMFDYAIENDGVFGLSYRSDASVGKDVVPQIGSIGCLAKITAVMPLQEGRMNLLTKGIIRLRVVGFNQMVPFLLSTYETVSDEIEPGEDLERLFSEVMAVGQEFLDTVAQMSDDLGRVAAQDLPDDPESFSLLLASLLPIDNDSKQALLETTSTRIRLSRLKTHVTTILGYYSRQLRTKILARSNGRGKLKQ